MRIIFDHLLWRHVMSEVGGVNGDTDLAFKAIVHSSTLDIA